MIDEKGRLFGKINIVDLLVILVIIIAAVVLGMKFLGPDGSVAVNPKTTHVTYQVLVESVQPQVYENVKKYVDAGDATLMASGEMLDGQVVAVESKPHTTNATVSASGDMLLVSTDKNLLDLTFTIECNVVNPITTEIGTQEVRIGKSHIVKTDRFEMNSGTIIACEWDDGTEE